MRESVQITENDMDKPLITIIIPVYNVAEYLPRCLESIINQTYENLEIILINDGSTDISGDICEDYANKDDRIRVIHKKNGGVSSARNTGIEEAVGQYIGFVDADDYIAPEMYKELLDAMVTNDVDIVACSYCFDYENEVKYVHNKWDVPTRKLDRDEFLYYVYKRDEYKGVANYIWTKLYKRELFSADAKIRFQEKYCVGEDIVFNATVYVKSKTFMYIDKPMYYYVQRSTSAVHNKQLQLNTLSLLEAYDESYAIYNIENVPKKTLNLVRRFYVYWCGKYIEYAKENECEALQDELKERIEKYLQVYIDTNKEYPERVKWILRLIDEDS